VGTIVSPTDTNTDDAATWSATAADGNCGGEAEVLSAGESLPSTRGAAQLEILQATDTSDCRQVTVRYSTDEPREPTASSSGGPPSYETAVKWLVAEAGDGTDYERPLIDFLWPPLIPCPLPPTLLTLSNDGRRSDETTVKSVDAFVGAGVDGWRPVSDDLRLPLIPTSVPRVVETPLSDRIIQPDCVRLLTTATSAEAGGGSTVQTKTATDFDGVITSDCLRRERSSDPVIERVMVILKCTDLPLEW